MILDLDVKFEIMSAKQFGFRFGAQKRSLGFSINWGVFRRKKNFSSWEFLIHLWDTNRGIMCLYTLSQLQYHMNWVGVLHTCVCTGVHVYTCACTHTRNYTGAVWV